MILLKQTSAENLESILNKDGQIFRYWFIIIKGNTYAVTKLKVCNNQELKQLERKSSPQKQNGM